jgi:hypothetical protein
MGIVNKKRIRVHIGPVVFDNWAVLSYTFNNF